MVALTTLIVTTEIKKRVTSPSQVGQVTDRNLSSFHSLTNPGGVGTRGMWSLAGHAIHTRHLSSGRDRLRFLGDVTVSLKQSGFPCT